MKPSYDGIRVSGEKKASGAKIRVKAPKGDGMNPAPGSAKAGKGKYSMGSANASKCTKKM